MTETSAKENAAALNGRKAVRDHKANCSASNSFGSVPLTATADILPKGIRGIKMRTFTLCGHFWSGCFLSCKNRICMHDVRYFARI